MQHWKPRKHEEQKAAVLELPLIGIIPRKEFSDMNLLPLKGLKLLAWQLHFWDYLKEII